MRTKRIFWSGETCVDRDTCRRFNPQNDRMYFPKGTKKDELLGGLRPPPRQPKPGIMARVAASSAQQGALAGRGLTVSCASRCPPHHDVLCVAACSNMAPPASRRPLPAGRGLSRTSPTPKKRDCRIKPLKTDVCPQIAALLEKGGKFWFQQDLASPRTAKLTKAFFE